MGAGTGDLNSSGDTFNFLLTFVSGTGHTGIPTTDEVYKHFVSALEFLISGLKGIGAKGTFTPNISSGEVTSISVVVSGPLLGTNRINFNRALNRLLWGARERKTPGQPSPSNWVVNSDKNTWKDENT